jgi:hypothetical protein
LVLPAYDFDKLDANLGKENLKENVLFEPMSAGAIDLFHRAPPRGMAQQLDAKLVAKYENLGFDLLPISSRFGRPVLKAIAAAWQRSVEELFISQEVDAEVGAHEYYAADGVDLLVKNPPLSSGRLVSIPQVPLT